jgi:hypothetical protein
MRRATAFGGALDNEVDRDYERLLIEDARW